MTMACHLYDNSDNFIYQNYDTNTVDIIVEDYKHNRQIGIARHFLENYAVGVHTELKQIERQRTLCLRTNLGRAQQTLHFHKSIAMLFFTICCMYLLWTAI